MFPKFPMHAKSSCTCLLCSGPCSWQNGPCFTLSGLASDFLSMNMFLASRDVTWKVNHIHDFSIFFYYSIIWGIVICILCIYSQWYIVSMSMYHVYLHLELAKFQDSPSWWSIIAIQNCGFLQWVSMLSHSRWSVIVASRKWYCLIALHSVCLQYEQPKGWGSSRYWFLRLLLKTILRPRKAMHTTLRQGLLCFSLAPRSVGVTKPFWNLTLVHTLPSPL